MKKSKKKENKVEKIKDLLSLNDPPQTEKDAILKNKKTLLTSLIELGATHAVIDYNGSGDSGQVDLVRVFCGAKEINVEKTKKIDFYKSETSYNPAASKGKDPWVVKIQKVEVYLSEALELIAEELLSYNDIDWYNNDGGYGAVKIDLKKEAITLEHNQRVMSTEYEEYKI